MRLSFSTSAAVLMLAVALGGCGSDDDSASTDTGATQPTTVPADVVPKRIQGRFSRTLTRADKVKAGARVSGLVNNVPTGRLNLQIDADGAVFIDHSDKSGDELDFVATSDNRIEVSAGSYCDDAGRTATYSWKRAGDRLTFKLIGSDCPSRRAVLSGTFQAR